MLITQWNSASFGQGDPFILAIDSSSFSANSPNTLGNNSARSFLRENSPINAVLPGSDLGEYSGQILSAIATRFIPDPSTKQSPITSGDPASGYYTRRNLYLTSGRLNVGPNYIDGQFVLNAEYFVDGSPPSSSNTNSTIGLFPVNGQYPLPSQYRQTLPAPAQNGGLPDQEFAINESDPIASQYAYNPVLAIQGNIGSTSPAFVTGYEFRNGQYVADLYSRSAGVANLQPLELETSLPVKSLGGQILVNGQNIFNGKFNSSANNLPYPVEQQGTVVLEGNYDDQGVYHVGTQALIDGPNSVQGYQVNHGLLTQVQINIEGAYSSGGQYILYGTTPPQLQQNTKSEARQLPSSLSSSPSDQTSSTLVEMASYLQTIAGLLNTIIQKSYGASSANQVLVGQYLNLDV